MRKPRQTGSTGHPPGFAPVQRAGASAGGALLVLRQHRVPGGLFPPWNRPGFPPRGAHRPGGYEGDDRAATDLLLLRAYRGKPSRGMAPHGNDRGRSGNPGRGKGRILPLRGEQPPWRVLSGGCSEGTEGNPGSSLPPAKPGSLRPSLRRINAGTAPAAGRRFRFQSFPPRSTTPAAWFSGLPETPAPGHRRDPCPDATRPAAAGSPGQPSGPGSGWSRTPAAWPGVPT